MSESYASSELPQSWKQAHVSAIHKKGPKGKADNYRPVSLTSIVGKIMEAIMRETMILHMQQHSLFTKYQFGFIPNRSTVLQLLTVLDKWSQAIDEHGSIDVIYFDFMKAFDRMPHSHLLTKLTAYGLLEQHMHGYATSCLGDFRESRWVSTYPDGTRLPVEFPRGRS